MQKTAGKYNSGECYVGIDTWGTDYGLLDKSGQPFGGCRCTRLTRMVGKETVEKLCGRSYLYQETGIQSMAGNTLYQLYERKLEKDAALEQAEMILMLPDYLNYFLTGVRRAEYTEASTSMMLHPVRKDWNQQLLEKLYLPYEKLPPVTLPGKAVHRISEKLVGVYGKWKLAETAGHDTACAVAAAALTEKEIFCSSGTWSIIGVERERPLLTEAARKADFSNEGTWNGTIRFLKNCTGMWVIQQCAKQWEAQGEWKGWDELIGQAMEAKAFEYYIDLEQPQFSCAGDMIAEISGYCQNTGQKKPTTRGEIARCVFENMAYGYKRTVDSLVEVTETTYTAFRIFGGGCRNSLLNQFCANVLQLPVYTGPEEAAALGNILIQLHATGEIKNRAELQEIAKASFLMGYFEPADQEAWQESYGKYRMITEKNC